MLKLKYDDERLCAYDKCAKPFEGRIDKIYCSDTCRNSAGREKQRKNKWNEPSCYGEINRILRRNYAILNEFCPEGYPKEIDKWSLLNKGFNFRFMTSAEERETGILFYCCYDYNWCELQLGKICIFAKESGFHINFYNIPEFLEKPKEKKEFRTPGNNAF